MHNWLDCSDGGDQMKLASDQNLVRPNLVCFVIYNKSVVVHNVNSGFFWARLYSVAMWKASSVTIERMRFQQGSSADHHYTWKPGLPRGR